MLYQGVELYLDQPFGQTPGGLANDQAHGVIDPTTGLRTVIDEADLPAEERSHDWFSFNLGDVYKLRAFFQARGGRLKPFWMPSWRRDLELSVGAASGSSTITIRACHYTSLMWPSNGARRHLYLKNPAPGGTSLVRHVTAAVDNGDGTETLTLVGPAGETTLGIAVATSWAVMFLRYVRFAEDRLRFEWPARFIARATISVRELPLEVPL
jgi:hypothetical protein